MLKKLFLEHLEIIAVLIVGVFLLLTIGEYMSSKVEIIDKANVAMVVIKLDRAYGVAPRSKVLRDAMRELQKELNTQVSQER